MSPNCAISVELPLGQYRGNLREQRVRRDYTRSPFMGEDIVRSAWQHAEGNRNICLPL